MSKFSPNAAKTVMSSFTDTPQFVVSRFRLITSLVQKERHASVASWPLHRSRLSRDTHGLTKHKGLKAAISSGQEAKTLRCLLFLYQAFLVTLPDDSHESYIFTFSQDGSWNYQSEVLIPPEDDPHDTSLEV